MFSYDRLYQRVFDYTIDADHMVIISGYIGPAIIQDLKNLPYTVDIYVGMYGNNISSILHKSLLKLNEIANISINYTRMLVHAKCYVWFKNNKIIKILIGSANFSTSGLMTPNKEVLGDLPQESFEEMKSYISLISRASYSVNDFICNERDNTTYIDELTQSVNDTEVEISLLASKAGGGSNIIGISTNPGDVHAAAGLNWGFSNGLSKPNDAYIKIPKNQIKNNPLMFPAKNKDINEPIDVIWDDGTQMQMLLEGNQTVDNKNYPKQIGTYKNKMELGIYLRNRIGKKIGKDLIIPTQLSKEQFVPKSHFYKDKFITKEMLEQYGRTTINIKLIGERTYYFDFSIND